MQEKQIGSGKNTDESDGKLLNLYGGNIYNKAGKNPGFYILQHTNIW